VTCGNVVSGCAGVPAGDEDVPDCAEGGSCAGVAGGDADSAAGATGGDAGWVSGAAGGDADSVAGPVCPGGHAWPFTSFTLAAANAR